MVPTQIASYYYNSFFIFPLLNTNAFWYRYLLLFYKNEQSEEKI